MPIAPDGHVQAPERQDILNIRGLGEAVFNVAGNPLESDTNRFVLEVEAVEP